MANNGSAQYQVQVQAGRMVTKKSICLEDCDVRLRHSIATRLSFGGPEHVCGDAVLAAHSVTGWECGNG